MKPSVLWLSGHPISVKERVGKIIEWGSLQARFKTSLHQVREWSGCSWPHSLPYHYLWRRMSLRPIRSTWRTQPEYPFAGFTHSVSVGWKESIRLQVCPSSTFHQHWVHLKKQNKQKKFACPRGLANRSVFFKKYLQLSQISVCGAVAAKNCFITVKPVKLTCTFLFLPSSSLPRTTETAVPTWFDITATINFDSEACREVLPLISQWPFVIGSPKAISKRHVQKLSDTM